MAIGRRPAPGLPRWSASECATEPAVIAGSGRRRHRRRDPRRRGRPGRRHGHLPAAQGRDLPLPARPGADRPPAGRLAGRPGRGPTPPCRTRSTRSRWPRPRGSRLARRRATAGRPAASMMCGHRGRPDLARAARRPARAATTSAGGHRLGDGRDHGRRGDPVQIAGFRRGAARQGRDRRRARRPGPGDARRTPHRIEVPGPSGRRGRHRRRPRPHGQHLDDGRAGRRRRRRHGWSSTATAPPRRPAARPTCSRSSASRSTSARAGGARSPRGRHHVLLRAGASTPRCATPRGARRELGVPTVVQLPRPADQPGPAAAPGGRLSPTRGWRRSWPTSSPARGVDAFVFRGDDGLDELTTDDHVAGLGRAVTAR